MQIVDLMLNDTRKALADKNITLEVTDAAKNIYWIKEQIQNMALDL